MASAPSSSAQEIRLPQALQTAVRQSPNLESARIDLEVTRAQVVQSLGIEDLLLRATGSYGRQSADSVEGDLIGTNSGSQSELGVDISKLLPTGGTVNLHVAGSRRSSEFAFMAAEFTEYRSEVSATLNQPLLRGRGKAISYATQRQAKHNLSASELSLRARARDEIQQILEAYWELVWAHKELEIRRSALTLAQKRRRLTESAIRLGSAPGTALLEVDQVMATSEEEILLAEQRITIRSLELRRLSGMEIGPGNLDLSPVEELNVSPEAFVLDEVLALAMQNDPNLAALAEQGQSAEIAIRVADDGKQPRLDLSLSAGPLGTDDEFGPSLEGLAKLRGYFVGGSLTFEQNIGTHNASGQLLEARAQRQRLLVSERDLRAQVATAAAAAVQSAHIASKRMELSRRAIDLSEKNIEAERRRFEAGKSTNFDVLERQEEQKQARLRFARAAVDYLRATIRIHALRGDLLERYGIKING